MLKTHKRKKVFTLDPLKVQIFEISSTNSTFIDSLIRLRQNKSNLNRCKLSSVQLVEAVLVHKHQPDLALWWLGLAL